MTQFFPVGNEDAGEPYHHQYFLWVVYTYLSGDYNGEGEAVAFDGEYLYYKNLGHCSCYGPWDTDDGGWERYSQSVIDDEYVLSLDICQPIYTKVVELLREFRETQKNQ